MVTGSSGGIGESIAKGLAREGVAVAVHGRNEKSAHRVAEEIATAGGKAIVSTGDLGTDAGAKQVADRALVALGGVDIVVNNAGAFPFRGWTNATPEDWDRVQNLNLRHQFFAAQAVRAHMRDLGGGSIVNLSSIAWMAGGPGMVAYTAAKAAIVGMTKSLAREFGDDNIRVNAIAPGAVMTERQRKLWVTPADEKVFQARQCLHRELLPVHIARAALFLASDDSDMLTKQCVIVDGGIR